MNYNSDVAHCTGYLCMLAEKCRRFHLFQEWKRRVEKENKKELAPFIGAEYDSEKDECMNFVENK